MVDSVLYIPYVHFLDIRNVRSGRSGKTCVYLKPSSRNPRNLIVYLALALFDPQGSLYYQPKQCTINGDSLKISHTFALIDSPQIGIFTMLNKSHQSQSSFL